MVAPHEYQTLICSEERCDLHDWEMVLDDEDGKRPRGRNPWRGICLRIAALDRLHREQVDESGYQRESAARGVPQWDGIDLTEQISSSVQREVQRAISDRFPPSAQKPRQRKGGTPL